VDRYLPLPISDLDDICFAIRFGRVIWNIRNRPWAIHKKIQSIAKV